MNDLHSAVRDGSIERTLVVLSKGVIDIDEGTSWSGLTPTSRSGLTPLMIAASLGHSGIVRILLKKGANTSLLSDAGATALHHAVYGGHLAVTVTKLLVKADGDLEATTSNTDSTPLHLAAEEGHSEVVRVLIEAGADPNSRRFDGSTSLFMAAQQGHVDTVKVLLLAKANPLLTSSLPSGNTWIPLDVAAWKGHVEVARELIQKLGIEGCGGASGGVDALRGAAERQHVEIMDMLTSAGVVDPGIALIVAAAFGQESSVKFLLQQQEWRASGEVAAYVNTCDAAYRPLICSIQACYPCSPRITRVLVDAGADTTSAFQLSNAGGVCFEGTPLALADRYLSVKKVREKDATESQLNSLEATRRLLMRVKAVYAVSWLWPSDVPCVTHADAEGTGTATNATPAPLILMLPILRQRAGRPRVLLAALFRHSEKPY